MNGLSLTCSQCRNECSADSAFCPHCGAPLGTRCPGCGDLSHGARFCPGCGHPLAAPPIPPSVPRAAGTEGETADPDVLPDDPDALVWGATIPLVTNRFFLGDLARVLCITAVILLALMGLMGVATGNAQDFPTFVLPILVLVAGLGLVSVLISLVVLGNRYHAIFQVSRYGAVFLAGNRERSLNEVATWSGLLSGNTRLLAAGILAEAGETVSITWKNVHSVKVHATQRVVALSDSWHTVMRIYCPPEGFDAVVARIRQQAAGGERWRRAHGVKSGGGVLPILGWLAGTAVVTLVGLAHEPEKNDVGFMVVLTAMFVALSGLLPGIMRRTIGVFGLLSGLVALAHRVYNAPEASDAAGAWISAAGCAGLVLLAAYQTFRSDRTGRETAVFDTDNTLEEDEVVPPGGRPTL